MATIYNKIGNIEVVGQVKVGDSYYTVEQIKAGLDGTGSGSGSESSHTHSNISVLNKFSDVSGELYYDGEPISAEIQVDPSNVSLDSLTDVVGKYNICGGMALEGITHNTVTESDVTKSIVQFTLAHKTAQNDRWVDLYYYNSSSDTYTVLNSNIKTYLQKGCFVYYSSVSNGKYVQDMNDFVTLVKSAKSAKTAVYFRLLNADGSYGTSNVLTLAYSTSGINRDLFVPVTSDSSTYVNIENMTGYSFSSQSLDNEDSDEVFDSSVFVVGGDIYIRPNMNDWTGLTENKYQIESVAPISESTLITNCYEITATLTSDTTFSSSKTYYTSASDGYYTKATVTADAAVTANTYYEITGAKTTDTKFVGGKSYWTLASNNYSRVTFDSYLVKLNATITSDETTTTFDVGSLQNPLIAVIASPNRDYVSSVLGEYNASVGYDAFTYGNTNFTGGNYSITGGINNTNNGDISFVFGNNNVNTAANSVVLGGSNTSGGDGNYLIGTANKGRGYYAVSVGCRNITAGVSICAVGFSNEIRGSRVVAVGSRVVTNDKCTDSIVVGSNIKCNAKNCFVLGCNGEISAEFEGSFPDSTTAITMTAAQFTAGGYATTGLHYKNSVLFVMGDGLTANTGDPLTIMSYTKYRWDVNNAYFAATNTSSARSGLEPQLIVPDHRWTFTGKMYMNFSEASLKSGSTTDYDCEIRDGGRVKTCDPGKVISSGSGAIDLDFNLAYKFKLKTSTSISLTLSNWVDGAEGYIAVYGGTTISWPATWQWTNTVPTSVASSATTAFALVKIMVIDSVVIATTIGNF